MQLHRICLILALIGLSACAHDAPNVGGNETSTRTPRVKTDYTLFAEPDVPSFVSSRLNNWDSTDANHVAIWTRPNEAYLLTLVGFCQSLRGAIAIGLTSTGNRVKARENDVLVGNERCRIERIQPLDIPAMKAAHVG